MEKRDKHVMKALTDASLSSMRAPCPIRQIAKRRREADSLSPVLCVRSSGWICVLSFVKKLSRAASGNIV